MDRPDAHRRPRDRATERNGWRPHDHHLRGFAAVVERGYRRSASGVGGWRLIATVSHRRRPAAVLAGGWQVATAVAGFLGGRDRRARPIGGAGGLGRSDGVGSRGICRFGARLVARNGIGNGGRGRRRLALGGSRVAAIHDGGSGRGGFGSRRKVVASEDQRHDECGGEEADSPDPEESHRTTFWRADDTSSGLGLVGGTLVLPRTP